MKAKANVNMILILTVGLLFACANSGMLVCYSPGFLAILVPCVLGVNALPMLAQGAPLGKQLWFLTHGYYCLRVFLFATAVSIPYQIGLGIFVAAEHPVYYLINLLILFCVLALTFYMGIILIYCTSFQLGLYLRIIGIVMGLIPIANVVTLLFLLKEIKREIEFETQKELLNQQREAQQICSTKYPILLVHGVFFRDFKYIGYWGRIPGQLRRNGAEVYFGNQPSAASVAECALLLNRRIRQLVQDTGCEKVNIIAHSKGGLDIRYAMAFYDTAQYIASVTTVSTPHRGSRFADYMLTRLPARTQKRICSGYNKALNRLGEPEADLMSAIQDLTTTHCLELDRQMLQPEGVLCRSFGSKMNKPIRGRFPMNFAGMMMQFMDNANDGMVSVDSFGWGESFKFLTTDSPVGISHCDMTDLNRTNLPGFDVREFYVQLVSELREKGL